MVYSLPPFTSSNASSYRSLLTALDANLDDLQLGGYGVSDTTLEEVSFYTTTYEKWKQRLNHDWMQPFYLGVCRCFCSWPVEAQTARTDLCLSLRWFLTLHLSTASHQTPMQAAAALVTRSVSWNAVFIVRFNSFFFSLPVLHLLCFGFPLIPYSAFQKYLSSRKLLTFCHATATDFTEF